MSSNIILLLTQLNTFANLKIVFADRFARQGMCSIQPVWAARDDTVAFFQGLYLNNFIEKQAKSYNISNRFEFVTRYNFKLPCGTMEYDPAAAIVDGNDAPDRAWPWQSLVYSDRNKCGGVLIDANWVLTAAHCVYKNYSYNVRLGSRYRWESVNDVLRKPEVKIVHEEFNITSLANDIALLKFSAPVNFTDRVRPACLPVYGQDFILNDFCYVSGFGGRRRRPVDILQQLKVYVVPDKECYYLWKDKTMKSLDWRTICAGRVRQRGGTCPGDSGGPLSCKIGGRYYVAGILSFSVIDCLSAFLPDGFTKVTEFIDWIFYTMSLYH